MTMPNSIQRCAALSALLLFPGPTTVLAQTHARSPAHADSAANSKQSLEASSQDQPPLPAAYKSVTIDPGNFHQGSPILITVETVRPATRVRGSFLGKEVSFFKSSTSTTWYALAGADVETSPENHDLTLTATVGGRFVKAIRHIPIAAGEFTTGSVDVPENFVNPDPAGKKQIAADIVLKARAYARSAPEPLWSGSFVKPSDAPSTPSFGETRILNEELTSQHRGTDFPIKEGAVVSAANSGTVVLARELFYEGNCIILDHGQHLYTIYMHLSKMDVSAGDRVRKGQHLGLTGATGRVTGPHLHMGVRWNGFYLDPLKLLALKLPETAADKSEPASANRHHRK